MTSAPPPGACEIAVDRLHLLVEGHAVPVPFGAAKRWTAAEASEGTIRRSRRARGNAARKRMGVQRAARLRSCGGGTPYGGWTRDARRDDARSRRRAPGGPRLRGPSDRVRRGARRD